jgi:drug/metabolite transporter (DMT)-like permease
MLPVIAILALTAIWGYTFVPVKDAVELYPVLAFLGVRFLIATGVLGIVAAARLPRLDRRGWGVGLLIGLLLAVSLGLQTLGLARTTVSSTGFITGLYVVLTPLFGLVLFRHRIDLLGWVGAAVAVAGLALVAGAPGADLTGDLLVLGSTGTQALQILLIGRYAARYDAIALTFAQVATCAVGLLAVAGARGELTMPHGGTVWYGLLVTALPATAFALFAQIWVQRRIPAARAAILFTLEVPFAALFGILLMNDSLGVAGWLGGAVIGVAILLVEPASLAWWRRVIAPAVS